MNQSTVINLNMFARLMQYCVKLDLGRTLLWCYVIWYTVMLSCYFDPNLKIWISSLGIAVIVGFALVLSTGGMLISRLKTNFWPTIRLFFCPFLVSSFSSITKEADFILILSPNLNENIIALGSCLLFWALISTCKRIQAQ